MARSPDSTKDPCSIGSDTLARYRYQALYTAIRALDLLRDGSGVNVVYCEHHDDFLIELDDGRLVAFQVKTRDAHRRRFRAGDKPILGAIAHFATLDQRFPGSFGRFVLATDNSFWQEARSASNLPYVLQLAASPESGVAAMTLSKYITLLNAMFLRRNNKMLSQEQALRVLRVLVLDSELSRFSDIEERLIGALSNEPLMRGQAYQVLKDAASHLVDHVLRISSSERQRLTGSWFLKDAPLTAKERERIAMKTLKRDDLHRILEAAIVPVQAAAQKASSPSSMVGRSPATLEMIADTIVSNWQTQESPLLPQDLRLSDIVQEPNVRLLNPDSVTRLADIAKPTLAPSTLQSILTSYSQIRKWAVVGPAGCGKTTLLMYSAVQHAESIVRGGSGQLPVFISVAGLAARSSISRPEVFEHIEDLFAICGLIGAGNLYGALAQEGGVVVLADGLDEIDESTRRTVCRAIESAFSVETGNRIVYSSRRVGALGTTALIEVGIESLTLKAQRNILISVCGKEKAGVLLRHISSSRNLRELVENPMMLAVFAIIALDDISEDERQSVLETLRTRSSLYETAVRILMEGRHRDFHGVKQPELAQEILATVSMVLHRQGGDRHSDLLHSATQVHAALGTVPLEMLAPWEDASRFLRDVSTNSGVLYAIDALQRTYAYLHRSVREYLCASFLSRNQEEARCLIPHLSKNQRWYGVLSLLAGLMDDSDLYLKQLLHSPPDLPLAAVLEVSRISPEMAIEILKLRPIRTETREAVFAAICDKVDPPGSVVEMLLSYAADVQDRIPRIDLFFIDEILASSHADKTVRESLYRRLHGLDPGMLDAIAEMLDEPGYWCHVHGGKFTMGAVGGNPAGEPWILPPHQAQLSAYDIGVVPVTNLLYEAFDPHHHIHRLDLDDVNEAESDFHPVVYVSWFEAECFTRWISLHIPGVRLPTEAEWEMAASRHKDGQKLRFPWGNQWKPSNLNNWEAGPNRTTRVGAYLSGRAPCGALDMAGNVWEWCSDWFDSSSLMLEAESELRVDPAGPLQGTAKVNKGGGWFKDIGLPYTYQRAPADRPEQSFAHCGFRLVRGDVKSGNTSKG